MNDVTREWWIPVLKRGCPMKDGKIYNKTKYLSQLVPVFWSTRTIIVLGTIFGIRILENS